MRIVTAPNQVVIQFGCEPGETAGAFRAASLSQLRFAVADDSDVIEGRLDSGRDDLPKDFPRDQIAALFGEKFETFEAQQRALADQLAKTKAELDRAVADGGALKDQLATVTASRDELLARSDAAMAALTAV